MITSITMIGNITIEVRIVSVNDFILKNHFKREFNKFFISKISIKGEISHWHL